MALPTVQSRLKKLRSKSTSTPTSATPSRSPSPTRSGMPTATPTNGREIGTLIVVVLKANHLPNKRHIGKQDPYCVITINGKKQRTKAIKKGGQHPEWDEELRFKIYEDIEEPAQNGTPPPLPPKDGKSLDRIQGGTTMKLACFADDMREPDFIGDTDVDLTEVLTKGETDEWFTLASKDRFAGKVYLELTFWSNEPPPQKKVVPVPVVNKNDWAGPGVFVPAGGEPQPPQPRIVSSSAIHDHQRRLSESIRPSSSMLDLYQPPYERNRNSAVETLNHSFGDLAVGDPQRSETYPPVHNGYRPPSPGFSTFSSQPPSNGYDPGMSNTGSGYTYDRPVTPNGPSTFRPRTSLSNQQAPYPPQTPYQPEYESSPSNYRPPPPARGPRYSIPATSSGFVPLSNSSSFSTHPSEPSGFAPPVSHTPAPYPSQINSVSYPPPLSHTPLPTSYSVPPSGFYDSRPGTIPLSDSQPSHLHPFPSSILSLPPISATPLPYGGYSPGPGPEMPIAPSNSSLSSSAGPGGSRPLPLPQGPSYSNLTLSSSQPLGNYSPSRVNGLVPPPPVPFPSVPPPPPFPSSHSGSPLTRSPQSNSPQPPSSELQQNAIPGPPPLPPPPSQYNPRTPNRRASLPVPPSHSNFQPLPVPPQFGDYQNIPPPPFPPSQGGPMFHPGPPPKPPAPLDGYSQAPTSVSYGGY